MALFYTIMIATRQGQTTGLSTGKSFKMTNYIFTSLLAPNLQKNCVTVNMSDVKI
jgi:hypothetical protein